MRTLKAILLATLLPFPSFADIDDTMICTEFYSLEPNLEKPGQYIFTYHNSEAQCSTLRVNKVVTAEDGFTVRLWVEVGVDEMNRERITVIPDDPMYMAYPPELLLEDSAVPGIIHIIPGVS